MKKQAIKKGHISPFFGTPKRVNMKRIAKPYPIRKGKFMLRLSTIPLRKSIDKVELLIKGNISFQLLFPNARILENVIPARSKIDHYRMVAIDASLFGIVKEWITNGCDISEEELVQVIELGVSV